MNQVQPLLSDQRRQSLLVSDLGRVWPHRRSLDRSNTTPRLFPDPGGRFPLFDDAGDLRDAVAR